MRPRNKESGTAGMKKEKKKKKMIKLPRTFQSRARELCYFPGSEFIRSEHDGECRRYRFAWGERGHRTRRKKESDVGGKMARYENFGCETLRLKIFRVAVSLPWSTKPRFAFDSGPDSLPESA